MADEQSAETSDRASEAPAATAPPGRRRRWLRRLLVVGAVVAVLVLAFVLMLPTLLSTGVGQRWLVGLIDEQIPGSIEADAIEVSWFSGQRAAGLTLRDPGGGVVLTGGRVAAPDVGLLPLAFGSRDLGTVQMHTDELHLRQAAGERTNLEQALFAQAPAAPRPREERPGPPREPDAPPQLPEDLSARVTLTVGRATYEGPDVDPVEVTDFAAQLTVPSIERIGLQIEGDLRQAGQTGRIDGTFQINDAFTAEGVMQLEAAQLAADAELRNLPVGMIDRLAGLDGQLVALLGEALDAQVDAQGPLDRLDAVVAARSPHLEQFDLRLQGTDEALTSPGGTIRLQLTPEAYREFTAADEAAVAGAVTGEAPAEPATLLEPVLLEVQLQQLRIPRAAGALVIEDTQVMLTGSLSPARMTLPERGPVALQNTQFSVQAEDLSEQLAAELNAVAELGQVQEPVRLSAVARNLLSETEPLAATVVVSELPVPLVDALAQAETSLTDFVGQTLNMQVDVAQQADGALAFEGQVQSPLLAGPFVGRYLGREDGVTQVALRTPSPIQWMLSPAAWQRLTGAAEDPARLRLLEPAPVQANLQDVRVALLPAAVAGPEAPLRIDPAGTRVFATFTSPAAAFRQVANGQPETLRVADVGLKVEGENLREVLNILANLRVESDRPAAGEAAQVGQAGPAPEQVIGRPRQPAPAGAGEPAPAAAPQAGSITSRTEIRELVSADGVVQFERARIQSESQIQSVPSVLLDSLLQAGGQVAALLGPTTSAELNLSYVPEQGGEALFTLNADRASARVPALISADWLLELREDARFDLQVTPEVSQVMLQRINPFLGSLVAARLPLTLVIARDGFVLPLTDFDWRRVSGNARLDIREFTITSTGLFGQVIQLLSQVGPVSMNRSYTGQLAPVGLAVQRGELAYDGLTLALPALEVAFGFSGNVNLATNDLDLRMALGGEALEELRGVSIPIGGTIYEPRLREDALAQALIEAGVQRGIGALLGDKLPNIFGTDREPRRQGDGTPAEPAPHGDAAEPAPAPRSPLEQLLDLIPTDDEEERPRDRQRQPRQNQPAE